MIIAVDGPAAAGKGTLARALARHFGYHFLDTGALYRMVALAALRKGIDPADAGATAGLAAALDPASYDDAELRTENVAGAASIVATHPGVRTALLGLQRGFAARSPGAVLDGRDIGTVVCPDADVKLFVTASPEVRAGRRRLELAAHGESPAFETVLDEIRARDARDASRAHAPLVPAADAVVIDTSGMSVDEAVAAAIGAVMARKS
jgi:cytidylate kinase